MTPFRRLQLDGCWSRTTADTVLEHSIALGMAIALIVAPAVSVHAQASGKASSPSSEELIHRRTSSEAKLLNEPLTTPQRADLLHDIQRINIRLAAIGAPPSARDGSPILPVLTEAIQISSDFKDLADQVTNPFDVTLETYDKLAQAVVGDEKPPKPSGPYSIDGFALKVESAAQALDALPPDQDIDATQYSVSLQQIASCVTQDSALATLHSYSGQMDQAITIAQANIDYLGKLKQAISLLDSDAQIFTKAAAIGANTPSLDWAGYFSSAWWDLDQHLNPALAHLNSATQRAIQTITSHEEKIQTQDSNLKSNLQLLQPNWCILGGNWSGQSVVDQFGIKTNVSLNLTNNGTQGATFTYNGTPMQPRSVSLTGKFNLTVVFGGSTLQGSFDPKYQKFVGKLTFPGSPGLASTVHLSGNGY